MHTLRARWLEPKRRMSGADDNRSKPWKGTFMTVKTRTQVTIQTRQSVVVIPLRESFNAWCEKCLDVVIALNPETILGALRVSPGSLQQLLANGTWHAVENGTRSLWICCNSLSANPIENEILIEGERP